MNEEEVKEIIGKITHPEIDASQVELDMVEGIKLKGNKVSLTMVFSFPGVPIKYMFMESIREPLDHQGWRWESPKGHEPRRIA